MIGMTRTLLEISNLHIAVSKSGVGTRLVEDVSFVLDRGETLGIVGESGSGKTLTSLSVMRLLNRPLHVESGRITFDGRQILALSDKEMRGVRGRHISMIFQEPMTSLNPVLTIGRQLSETLRAHFPMSGRQAEDKAVALLERVRIPNAAGKLSSYPFEFSGGMRQRVMIAMAMICEPKLIIADEPTTALDVTIQAEVLALLKELKDEFRTSMIFVSHDLDVIADVCDNVLVMFKGRIVEQGSVREVMKNPRHPYTRALLGARPTLRTGEQARTFDRRRFRLEDVNRVLGR
ncbi:MAG: ABC transporter ATP-binding protein [Burkholderiaceae bacterium]